MTTTCSSLAIALHPAHAWKGLPAYPAVVAALCALALALASGCGVPGESGDRLRSGACPPGETCVASVSGLTFRAFGLDEHIIGRTAVGGRQTLAVAAVDLEGRPAYAPEFGASSSDETFLRVESLSSGITVRGVAEGEAFVRVTQNGTGALLDRLLVGASRVAHVGLTAGECTEFGYEHSSIDVPLDTAIGCSAVWAEASVSAAFYMTDAAHRGVWDDSIGGYSIDFPLGVVVMIEAPESGTFEFGRLAESGAHAVSLPVVSDVLDLELTDERDAPLELRVGTPTMRCALGTHDALDGRRGAILGAPAEFIVESGALLVEPPTPPTPYAVYRRASWTPGACRDLTLTGAAPARLTVQMGTLRKTFDVVAAP